MTIPKFHLAVIYALLFGIAANTEDSIITRGALALAGLIAAVCAIVFFFKGQ